ncbi:palmitoyltransferase ZDHHC23 [Culicoides brevitarsis]|uniref:palmitoyltransferase ZDHHC23 n=1 Tax=Culicoides brevitarsis TaxID=469753 RepID=UPI00307BB826
MNYDDDDLDPLCCCEYYDRHKQRNHIFLCCCQCTELDEVGDRFFKCQPVERRLRREMWLTIMDRMRIPYPGGARPMFCESLVTLFLVLFSQLTAAINVYSTCIVCILLVFVLFYARRKYQLRERTNFYFYWCIWSVAYLVVLFQTNVPIMEVLPEENLLFVVLLSLMLLCFYMVHRRNKKSYSGALSSSSSSSGAVSGLDEDDSATVLLISPDNNTENTTKDCDNDGEYELWISAYINYFNYKYYIAGCCLGTAAFLWYSNLVVTTVCHPFPVFRIFHVEILMPDDCTDVYDQYELALCFVGALYALVFAIFLFAKFVQEIYYIVRSLAFSNWKSEETRHSRRNCINNWRSFLCN